MYIARFFPLIGTGVVVLILSGILAVIGGSNLAPGELVVPEPHFIWQSPPPVHGRTPATATATFELENVGGRSVRILSMESGCGCAEPRAEPELITPGRKGRVAVEAMTIPIGERVISITIKTDSPITPTVTLTFHIIGTRQPPFLLRVTGDLIYLGSDLSGEKRQIEVITIEKPNVLGPIPVLETELSFLQFHHVATEERPYTTPDSIQRIHTFQAVLNGTLDSESFVGELRVIDPWDQNHIERLNIHGQAKPSIHVSPRSLTFVKEGNEEQMRARVLVRTRDPAPDLMIELEGGEASPVIVETVGSKQSDMFRVFQIRLKSDRPIEEGIYDLTVRLSPSSSEKYAIPVHIRAHGGG